MNPFEMVVMIVAIVMISSVVKARYGRHQNEESPAQSQEAIRLKDEVAQLKERIAVLERLATDDNNARNLDREIEKLR